MTGERDASMLSMMGQQPCGRAGMRGHSQPILPCQLAAALASRTNTPSMLGNTAPLGNRSNTIGSPIIGFPILKLFTCGR